MNIFEVMIKKQKYEYNGDGNNASTPPSEVHLVI